ncbi:Uncharacterized protein DAT39_008624, partial [Clarias magur]
DMYHWRLFMGNRQDGRGHSVLDYRGDRLLLSYIPMVFFQIKSADCTDSSLCIDWILINQQTALTEWNIKA